MWPARSLRKDAPGRAVLLEAGVDDVLPPDCDIETLQCRLLALARLKGACDQLRQVQGELAKTLARENSLLAQLREDNRDLKVRSITDGLTSLYNYRYLMEWLKTEFKISRRYGHNLSMVIVDLDHFKAVNDEHGHPFGDYVLKEIAVILKRCARDSDLVARYAGDEFALICPRAGHKEVHAIIKRILVACRKHNFEHKGKRLSVSLSLGAATYPEDPEVVSPEMLVFLSDQALYHSKGTGRNRGTAWHEIDADTRARIRRELRGTCHPLLADDPKSRLELAAAAKLLNQASAPPPSPGRGPTPRRSRSGGRPTGYVSPTGWPSSRQGWSGHPGHSGARFLQCRLPTATSRAWYSLNSPASSGSAPCIRLCMSSYVASRSRRPCRKRMRAV